MEGFSQAELTAIRRDLHKIPEIGLREEKTSHYLREKIDNMQTAFMEIRHWQTGTIVFIKGYQPEKTYGWRTDIDGLPILEENLSDYQSRHVGAMHACGHDFHMTIALGLLKNRLRTQPKNNFLFLFQPAEENDAGGMLMYEDHAFEGIEPDEFYALHVAPELPTGVIGTRVGTLFAGTCTIHATLTGKGGHAAFPHLANDMVIAACQFIQQAQTIVSRNVDPIKGAVVTFGSLHAGTTNNVIAGEAKLAGTIRTFTQEMSELTQRRVKEIAAGIALSFNCEIEMHLEQKGYFPVVNHPETTEKFMAAVNQDPFFTFEESQPAMTGEDFGYLLDKYPGTMFWLGVDSPYGLHHPKFNPKESVLAPAVKFLTNFFEDLDQA